VIEAENGECGLRIAEAFKEHIDILITDVVMPGIGGRELAKKLVALRPGISVLYLSGYTEDAVVTPGALGPATAFLQKALHPAEPGQESPRGAARPVRASARHQVNGEIGFALTDRPATAATSLVCSPKRLQLFSDLRVL
jgi:CheY-like chemotaxis protein